MQPNMHSAGIRQYNQARAESKQQIYRREATICSLLLDPLLTILLSAPPRQLFCSLTCLWRIAPSRQPCQQCVNDLLVSASDAIVYAPARYQSRASWADFLNWKSEIKWAISAHISIVYTHNVTKSHIRFRVTFCYTFQNLQVTFSYTFQIIMP